MASLWMWVIWARQGVYLVGGGGVLLVEGYDIGVGEGRNRVREWG